ncbi:hypothetical protein Q0Z83_009330 [Actinoplanes sichuanensis]|uniref:Uncharacterized protein n=1 Tax=Actinoplanes sichuanensis TaxID=512349 RepID=A0ABW4AEU6_9ACTN|nr:hypothetical protein [Actinoplanes sichuanensis]BEL02742.1 hypothetical protein Q0Z83_009330 [Actinoplanes sichuanensis]
MTFRVDPEALDQAAALLDRNRNVIPDIQRYITKHLSKGTADQLGGQGLLAYFSYNHDEQIERADHRLHWVNGVWQSGAVNLGVSAATYRSIEKQNAAELDAAIRIPVLLQRPALDPDPAHWDHHFAPAAGFDDVADPTRAVASPPDEPTDSLEPKAAEVAQWVGKVNDTVSLNWWLRFAIKEVYGRDPVKEALDWLAGDWTVFARYAVAWKHVAFSVAAMTDNIAHTDDALAATWDGNAATLGLTWMQHLHDAMTVETEFYDKFLYGTCEGYIEIAYYGYENLNYLVGELIDLLLEAALAIMGLVTDGLSTIAAAVIALCDAILFIVDFFRQIYHAGKILTAIAGLPEEPPLVVADLLLADPDPLGRNCISVPASK